MHNTCLATCRQVSFFEMYTTIRDEQTEPPSEPLPVRVFYLKTL